jgi:AbrB family looped-hinge helix DNA binding protein
MRTSSTANLLLLYRHFSTISKSDIQAFGQIMEISKVGKRGVIVVPAPLRRKFGIKEGGLVAAEERPEGILIRRVVALPVEIYTPERKAEFLLSNAVDENDYSKAVAEVRKLGIAPSKVPHQRPVKRARR